MKLKNILYVGLILIIGISCTKEPMSTDSENTSSVELQVKFDQSALNLSKFNKIAVINRVSLAVTGPGMNTIQQDLEKSGNQYTGTVSVPKGDNRQFKIEGIDENNIVQFGGEKTQNLANDNETVEITVEWTPPPAVSFSISNVTASTAEISWAKSNVPDFAFYRILFSNSPPLDPNNDVLGDVTDVNRQSVNVEGLNPDTDYFAKVLVVDTEGWFQNTNAQQFTTLAAEFLTYNDGSRENGLRWNSQGVWFTVQFTCPSYPCKIENIEMHLTDNGTGNELAGIIVDSQTGDEFFSTSIPSTNDGWITLTPDWNSVAHDGVVNSDFDAGIEFLVDTDAPFLSCDTNSVYNAGRSWVLVPQQSWDPIDVATGREWNFMINATVILGSGDRIVLKPSKTHWEIARQKKLTFNTATTSGRKAKNFEVKNSSKH